jgi:hypothetical protein
VSRTQADVCPFAAVRDNWNNQQAHYQCGLPGGTAATCRKRQNTRWALRALVKKAGRKSTLDAKAERLHTALRAPQMRLLPLVEGSWAGPSFAARGSHSQRRERLAFFTLFTIVILFFLYLVQITSQAYRYSLYKCLTSVRRFSPTARKFRP